MKRALGLRGAEVYGNGEGNSNGNGVAVVRRSWMSVARGPLDFARPLAFRNRHDQFLLRGRQRRRWRVFDRIGRRDTPTTATTTSDAEEEEEEERRRERGADDYDEMQIAALLAVSVLTHFINRGGRGTLAAPRRRGGVGSWTAAVVGTVAGTTTTTHPRGAGRTWAKSGRGSSGRGAWSTS